MVVKVEEYDSASCRAFNAIVVAFSWIFPYLPLSYSFLVLILYPRMARSITLNGRPFLLSSALPGLERVLPQIGPSAQHIHRYGFPGLSLPQLLFLFLSLFVGVCGCGGGGGGGGGAFDLVLVGYRFVLICVLGCGGCTGCVVVAIG